MIIALGALADYPIVSHRFLADPGALVYKDRVYLYCSNDDENPTTGRGDYRMKSIVCISSNDLKNWTDHGIVFQVPEGASWASRSWAPSAVERNGHFYLYFGNGGNGIGVAMSDSPTGPFTDPIGKPLIETKTPGVMPAEHMWLFDPMVFIDDDGQAYLYFGGNGDNNVRVIKLNPDMISVNGSAIHMTAPNFFEAAWMHKNNGIYYFSYSSNPSAGMRIDYMKSSHPTSGFKYGGVVSLQPPNNHNNNHQAIFKLKGNWYQAYHNRIVAEKAGIPMVYKRNICIDKIQHNIDGNIDTMINTIDGLQQLLNINPFERIEAETFCKNNGIKTQTKEMGGMEVCNIDNDDYIMVKGVDFKKGARAFEAKLSNIQNNGTIEIRLDSISGIKVGVLKVEKSEIEKKTYLLNCKTLKIKKIHDVYFIFKSSTNDPYHFDWWKFTKK